MPDTKATTKTETGTENDSAPSPNLAEQVESADPACHETEWMVLHESIESYEKLTLVLKLAAPVLAIVYILTPMSTIWLFCLLLLLWLQEAIWRTGQGRLESRIRQIEQALSQESDRTPIYHLYSDWQNNRGDSFELVSEYLAHARRPTVAYPYVVVIALAILAWIF